MGGRKAPATRTRNGERGGRSPSQRDNGERGGQMHEPSSRQPGDGVYGRPETKRMDGELRG
jgi:hypothetical protein